MSRATHLLAAATPAPEPSQSADLLPDDKTSPNAWLEWFLGLPLRIVIIVAVGTVVLILLRRAIRGVTDHVADGTPWFQRGVMRPLGESDVARTLLRATDPLATARRSQRARTLGSVLRSTATVVVGTIMVLLVLAELGVNIAPFIASAGIVGVALGFGAQSLVKDFLTGLFMLLEDQYGVGDVVDVGPATGTVEAVTLRVTKIRDSDGTLWYVPNGSMLRVGNKTQGWATAVVEIDVDYFADLDQVRALLREAAARVEADPVLGAHLQGAPTITGIERLSADAITLRLKVRTSPAMQWDVARALRTATRDVLERADVPLAGQRDLLRAHRDGTAPADEPSGDADETPDDAHETGEQERATTAEDRETRDGAPPRDPHDTPVHDVAAQRDARRAAPPGDSV
ncbi:mechanosensitive ion channel family protein [Cellulomonas fimi]|uniref:MscS Mechanosensitive ion channel n=1 Tax=Cellulomonas fimi (strain ATCC 484 / DSM 20113 / JCM 1341 / CCUG 24087 / LMG 16345 / NBRC 15513 / NCIMB 8980 / NCTC 7547 / NRS-133) TaxID=590998 RepID=F4H5T0_CELFA|nr:mechanosensitive ion channel family protein [Cellulomonas fimi]AEE45530.1 MscS Mechanosensitive ion channel [Cellulomonas fimi ATCC 484]NNH05958.1 mechanosensitive ion channel family protein [Cellulomonas fimi]VEH29744.1 Potassium efflux system KefA precursor [Cellulomonas fimi]